jgi:hypothetical protein
VKALGENFQSHKVSLLDGEGNVVAEVVYTPEHPLSCGATCYVQTQLEIKVDD